MSTGLVAVGGALRSPVSVVEPPRSSFRGPVVSTDLPPQQSSTAHLSGERGTGRVSKWRPHHCPRLATARSPPPRQCISGSTPSKRRCASQGRDCRCAWVMGKRVGVANPASAHAFVAKTTPPPPRRPPFQPGMGSLTAQIVKKYCRRPRFCFFCSRAPFSTPRSSSAPVTSFMDEPPWDGNEQKMPLSLCISESFNLVYSSPHVLPTSETQPATRSEFVNSRLGRWSRNPGSAERERRQTPSRVLVSWLP